MYAGLHVKYPLLLPNYNETWHLLDRFSKKAHISNFTKTRPVGAELFFAGGQTDGHKEADSHFSQFCERARSYTKRWDKASGGTYNKLGNVRITKHCGEIGNVYTSLATSQHDAVSLRKCRYCDFMSPTKRKRFLGLHIKCPTAIKFGFSQHIRPVGD
jgi:hypothetical protein